MNQPSAAPAQAAKQPPAALAKTAKRTPWEEAVRLQDGDTVKLTLKSGEKLKGTLYEVKRDGVAVAVGGRVPLMREIPFSEIKSLQRTAPMTTFLQWTGAVCTVFVIFLGPFING